MKPAFPQLIQDVHVEGDEWVTNNPSLYLLKNLIFVQTKVMTKGSPNILTYIEAIVIPLQNKKKNQK